MSISVIVFGGGRFGRAVARELFENDVEVMLVDKDYEVIQHMGNYVTTAVQCDISVENDVETLGISNFDIAVIAIGSNLEASIVATLLAKEYGVRKIIAKASSEMQAKILAKLGADDIIRPESDMGIRLARKISGPLT